MNIEKNRNELIQDLRNFLPKIFDLPSDKALYPLRKESWRLADKYGVNGEDIIIFMFNNYQEIKSR